ncbi:hypothetical protein LJC68_04250 [Bacteroidales bacterium OttesenSCG-928-B11]|nr:hypothetical protein [Bacteroidales bacterium OttesenSCG-928-E04]MDL2309466.1 hypothetical protein [Bacteroidales bacterium OttesenSCG-928-C03]MDL2312071.1 hypothetical protein [Bacteroidales bacterium OttesenSCG-928-B11]MDL2325681.1 hypothetical protein [Bacteroidales bacterium OttesenSCG-928-A14]
MRKICLAIMALVLFGSLTSCDKDCVCSVTDADGSAVGSTVVGQMSKDECDTFIWVIPPGSTYKCASN